MKRDVQAFLRRAAGVPRPTTKTEPDASDYLKIALGHAPDVEEHEEPKTSSTDLKAGMNTQPQPPTPPSPDELLRRLSAR